MAQLPADRTKLAQAQSNMNPSLTASSQKLKDALTEAYDTVDLLNQKVNDHGAAVTLPHADKSVTRPKLADKVVGAGQLDDAAVGQSHHQDNGIPGRALPDNVILQRHMSDNSVGSAEIQAGAVQAQHIPNGTINSQHIDAALLASSASLSTQAEFDMRGINVQKFGAKGDGVTNDTASFQSALTYALQNNKKMIIPNGKYLVNFVIANCENILIEGNGKTNYYGSKNGGTILKPYDLTKPVISIGDGVAQANNIQLQNMNIEGDLLTTTSDGLVINGAFNVNIDNVSINNFGQDNVKITSTVSRFSCYIYFNGSEISRGLNSCLNMSYGGSFTTAVYINNCKIESATTPNCKSIILDSATLNLTNVWVQANTSKVGHISLLNTNSGKTIIIANNVAVDSGSSTDVLITLDKTEDYITNYIEGTMQVDGLAEWSDGKRTNLTGRAMNIPLGTRMRRALVSERFYFNDSLSANVVDRDVLDLTTNGLYLTRQGNTLWVKNGTFAWDNDFLNPLRFDTTCFFLNKTKKQLRFYKNSKFAVDENSGDAIATFVPVPASATATGNPGEFSADASFLYICTAANTWKRVAIAAW